MARWLDYPENEARLREQMATGKPQREIAETLGIPRSTITSYIHDLLRKEGLYSKRKSIGTPQERAEMKRLYESGVASTRIGEKFGISRPTVIKILREEGVEILYRGNPYRSLPVPAQEVDCINVSGTITKLLTRVETLEKVVEVLTVRLDEVAPLPVPKVPTLIEEYEACWYAFPKIDESLLVIRCKTQEDRFFAIEGKEEEVCLILEDSLERFENWQEEIQAKLPQVRYDGKGGEYAMTPYDWRALQNGADPVKYWGHNQAVGLWNELMEYKDYADACYWWIRGYREGKQ